MFTSELNAAEIPSPIHKISELLNQLVEKQIDINEFILGIIGIPISSTNLYTQFSEALSS